MTEWRDKSVLKEMYCERKLSCREIGSELGCAARTVSKWLDRHGIKVRQLSEANSISARKRPANFETYEKGYERWTTDYRGERSTLRVHRLLAVAEYGFEAVVGNDVHHINHIPWDNRPENIRLLSHADHSRLHHPEGPS